MLIARMVRRNLTLNSEESDKNQLSCEANQLKYIQEFLIIMKFYMK